MAWISFGTLLCRKNNLTDLRLDVVEIARPWHASELFSFLIGLRTYQHLSAPSLVVILSCRIFWNYSSTRVPHQISISRGCCLPGRAKDLSTLICSKFGGCTVMLDVLKLLSDACSTPDRYFRIVRPLTGMANRLRQCQFPAPGGI